MTETEKCKRYGHRFEPHWFPWTAESAREQPCADCGKTRGLKPWRVYGRHGRLAAVIEAFDRNHADHMVDCMVEEHRPYHDSCQSHTCDLWGLPGYGFIVQGTREYWSVMKFGSVGDPDSDEGADTTYNVHPDCRGHRHLTREDAAACPAMTDE